MMDFSKLKSLSVGGVELKQLFINGVQVWAAGRLPSEYQEVEWIETDGNAWFVSNFDINELDNFTIYYRYSAPGSSSYMFGANGTGTGNPRFLHRYSALIMNINATTSRQLFDFKKDNTFHTYKIECVHQGNTTVYEDGVLLTLTNNNFYNQKVYYPFGVFCNNYALTPSSYKAVAGSKISELRFFNNITGKDAFNPVPCYRKADGVVGMYDTVSKTFYTNQGTGAFTAGPGVTQDAPGYTNQIPISTDANGNLYVGTNGEKGYKTGYRLSASGGGETAYTNSEVVGFIPVTMQSVLRIKDIAVVDDNYHVLCGYDANKTKLTTSNAVKLTAIFTDPPVNGVYTSKSLKAYGHTSTDSIAYIRISSSDINANSIITVNEEIT